jgi:hypothetical protein
MNKKQQDLPMLSDEGETIVKVNAEARSIPDDFSELVAVERRRDFVYRRVDKMNGFRMHLTDHGRPFHPAGLPIVLAEFYGPFLLVARSRVEIVGFKER